MTCAECQHLLQEFIDQELGPAEVSAMDAHIATCEACQRLHRRMCQFTTTLVKAVSPVRPSGDFSSRVLARCQQSRAESQRVVQKAQSGRTPGKTFPAWPFALGIGAAVLLGLYLLLAPARRPLVGTVSGSTVRITYFAENAWKEYESGSLAVYSGDAVEAETPGEVATIRGPEKSGWEVRLRARCKVQLGLEGSRLVVALWDNAPGRVYLKTRAGQTPGPLKTLRFTYGAAFVDLKCGEENAVEIHPGGELNERLTVSVRNGSARVGNVEDQQQIAARFSREVFQKDPCAPAVSVESAAFSWVEEP